MRVSATMLVLFALAGGCGEQSGARQRSTERMDLEPPPDSLAPVALEIGCPGVFVDAPQVRPPWTIAGYRLDACQRGLTHDVKQPYDDCEPFGWTLTACELRPGRQFCQNGHWTTLCRSDDNCPTSMRCAWAEGVGDVPAGEYGWCAKTCTGSGRPDDCVRCDLECDAAMNVCRAKIPPIPAN